MSLLRDSTQAPKRATSDPGHGLNESSRHLAGQATNTFVLSTAAQGSAKASSPLTASSSPSHRIRRRNRMIASCLECRRRKLKCDKLHPCTNCAKFVRDCVFLAPALDSVSQLKLTEIKEKMGVLERGLEGEVANAKKQHRLHLDGDKAVSNERIASPASTHHVRKVSINLPGELSHELSDEDGTAEVPEDEKGLEPTPLAVVDAAYDDDADDDVLDLGVKMGKMRMTERLGGYFRPKMTEELSFTLNLPRSAVQFPEDQRSPVTPISPRSPLHVQRVWKDKETFLEPGPTYIAPGSGFFFGNPGSRASIIDFLPSRLAGDRLVKQYHDVVHFIARVVHWPSFETQYDNFWANTTVGIEPLGSLQAVVFAVMFSAVVSMKEDDITALFSVPKRNLMASFQTATEVALGKANFLRTTKIETLQALVIYLIPMCRDEMSRAHSVLVGTAIRLAECMGIHRDPQQTYGLGPLESHTRRTLWCQLCFLDIRTAEAQGPRPLIKRDEFDTNFPLNINDADLTSGNPKERTGWTDMTFSRIRFECNEMHRVIWNDRSRLERKQIGLTHVLGKIESFRKAMEDKYHPIIDENVPLQKEAKIVMNLLLLRMHIMVLHRYHTSSRDGIPDRLRQIILSTGTQQMEDAIRLETEPVLQPWAWYCGAYQQWHTAYLLLVEVYSFPMRREADRIWRILDYVFETDPSMTREQKGRAILSGLRDRTGAYRDFRKIRAPINMMSRIYTAPSQKPDQDEGRSTLLDFNSDPTPAASRSIQRPPLAYRLSYEQPNMIYTGPGNLNRPIGNQAPQSQVKNRTPFNSAYAVRPITAVAPTAAANLGQITKALADAPSPIFSADSLHDQNWTFDTPSTFFMAQSQVKTPKPNQLPGEQRTQTSPPPSDATGSPNGYSNPNIPVMGANNPLADMWGGGRDNGDLGQSVHPPPGLVVDENSSGVISPSIMSPVSGSESLPLEMKGNIQERGQQAAGMPGLDSDMMMVDIDWVPSIIGALIKNPFLFDMYDLSTVETVVTGSAAEALEKIQPKWLLQPGYGLTESGVIISFTVPQHTYRGSDGCLLPMVEARLVNDDGTEVEEYGACGELYLRAPTIMKGYFGDEAANATALDQQGWLRTGDVAIFKKDAEGNAHLFIVDRKKDIMKVKGLQVAPVDIEAHLLSHAAVAEAAVISVPDEDTGERPFAFIVRSDKVMSDLNDRDLKKEINQHVESTLSEPHWLRNNIAIVTDIPKSHNGKALKFKLRESVPSIAAQ